MQTIKPKAIARATRNGRAAYLIPLVRARQPVTNREWREQRRRAREADIFVGLFAKLLRRTK
jgi:hypothetical protein